MSNLTPPLYYVKLLSFSGAALTLPTDATAVVGQPLPVANVSFTETVNLVGQRRIGEFALALHDLTDPRFSYLRASYRLLNYEQRVEIYERADLKGTPVFTGVITSLPAELSGGEVRGEDILHRLDVRRLRHYEVLSGVAPDLIDYLLGTYRVLVKDDFNIPDTALGTLDANWAAVNNAQIHSNQLRAFNNIGSSLYWRSAAIYTAAQWNDCKISFDFWTDADIPQIYISMPSDLSTYLYLVSLSPNGGNFDPTPGDILTEGYVQIGDSGGTIATRQTFNFSQIWNHVDIYLHQSGGTRNIVVVLNNLEMINISPADPGTGALYLFWAVAGNSHANSYSYYDNFIFCTRQYALQPGTLDAGTDSLTQESNGDSQFDALNLVCDQAGWEYRYNPQAGEGNDTLDAGASVGRDLSNYVQLEEGKNIIALRQGRTAEGLATSLSVYGQNQDDLTANIIVNDLAAFDTFGIIEQDYSDPRVLDTATAQLIGQNRLALMSAGSVSLSGTVVDESALTRQLPTFGSAIFGDAVFGGLQRLRAGDWVWLKADGNIAVDRKVRIVSLSRRNGEPAIDLTFDYFGWRQRDQAKQERLTLRRLYLQCYSRLNTQSARLVSTGVGDPQTWYPFLRGNQFSNVLLDLTVVSGAGNVTLTIDGVACPLTSPAGANHGVRLGAYVKTAGSHTFVFTFAAAKTVDVVLHARVIA